MSSIHLYLISGLGADERMFERLQFPPAVHVHYVQWLEPARGESFSAYCLRLAEQIKHKENVVLAGLSFGGMVCIELNKVIRPKKILLFSSISTRQELPLAFRLIGRIGLDRVVPAALLKIPNLFTYWWFGVQTAREKHLLRHYLKTVSPLYLKWSINAVLNWTNRERPSNIFHIHGTADHIFPRRKVRADLLLKGAGHFMVHSQAQIISRYLNRLLEVENGED